MKHGSCEENCRLLLHGGWSHVGKGAGEVGQGCAPTGIHSPSPCWHLCEGSQVLRKSGWDNACTGVGSTFCQ